MSRGDLTLSTYRVRESFFERGNTHFAHALTIVDDMEVAASDQHPLHVFLDSNIMVVLWSKCVRWVLHCRVDRCNGYTILLHDWHGMVQSR